MDNMKTQMHKARITAAAALIVAIILGVIGGDTDTGIWFRISAFCFMGLFAKITITRTIAASVYASTQVTAQVITDVKAGR